MARLVECLTVFAIAGDFMSAATLLGITAIIFGAGYDAVIYLGAPLGPFFHNHLLNDR
ncbi:MAG: hypothetical protein Ct9H300mP22_0340 [Gammaproteobacteria bacterium]|nr:MAG: hypothetical protein Ct9H300mP22_0340 [Gammaproteobacteria bacterium]